MPRSMPQPKGSAKNEEHFIWVSGLPIGWTWQSLKDYVRDSILNQPKWTDVIRSAQSPGLLEGYFRVTGKDDADRAYQRFADPSLNNNVMLVHEWELSRDGASPTLIRCNCSSRHRELPPGAHSPQRSGIDLNVVARTMITTTTSAMNPPVGMVPGPVSTAAPAYPYGYSTYTTWTQQYGQYYGAPVATMAPVPRAVAMVPAPVYSNGGIPVNSSNGVVRTEARGIHITGLSYACSQSDLMGLLTSYGGRPVQAKVQQDARTGKGKGWATAQFASAAEAQVAVNKLNQSQHLGKTIMVRHDKDATSVGQVQGPVIANGSTTYKA